MKQSTLIHNFIIYQEVAMICNLFFAYVPPSDEVEMGDDIPRSVSTLTSISAMSVIQTAAVANNSGEVERQRQIAEYERQQQENILVNS